MARADRDDRQRGEYSPDGKLTLWMNTQTLFMARGRIAWALDMREGDIRIIQPCVGGGFGGKSLRRQQRHGLRGAGAEDRAAGEDHQHARGGVPGGQPAARADEDLGARWASSSDGTVTGQAHRPDRRQRRLLRQGAGRLRRRRRCATTRSTSTRTSRPRRYLVYTNKHPHGRLPRLRQPVRRVGGRAGLDMAARQAGHRPARAHAPATPPSPATSRPTATA